MVDRLFVVETAALHNRLCVCPLCSPSKPAPAMVPMVMPAIAPPDSPDEAGPDEGRIVVEFRLAVAVEPVSPVWSTVAGEPVGVEVGGLAEVSVLMSVVLCGVGVVGGSDVVAVSVVPHRFTVSEREHVKLNPENPPRYTIVLIFNFLQTKPLRCKSPFW